MGLRDGNKTKSDAFLQTPGFYPAVEMCLTEKNEEREGGQWNEVALSVRWAPCIGFFFEGWLCHFYLREVCVVLFFSSFFRRLFLDTHSVKPDFFGGVQTQPHLLSGPAGQALEAAWKCLDWV